MGATRRGTVRLTADGRGRLARLLAERGYEGSAAELGTSPTVLYSLSDGGMGQPPTVARVEAALVAWAERQRKIAS